MKLMLGLGETGTGWSKLQVFGYKMNKFKDLKLIKLYCMLEIC